MGSEMCIRDSVGGLPKDLQFKLVEPLRKLFKDEVRKLGSALGLPNEIIKRHPFPGPGLGVRVIGEVTKDRVSILQEADHIYIEILKKTGERIAVKIKSHHNVGGLPKDLQFKLVEPLRKLFKDEVRKLGSALWLPDEIIKRHPFPGPGLAIRILGEVNNEKLDCLRDADWIVRDEIKKAGLYNDIWQAFAVLLPVKTVGVMGDKRTYAWPIVLRCVSSEDGMTADWSKIPFQILERIANRIVNEVVAVNRVVYDITSKPPGTIEWE